MGRSNVKDTIQRHGWITMKKGKRTRGTTVTLELLLYPP